MPPDLLAPNLRVVFCGTAAGTRSAAQGAYYAGRGNKFWRTLYEVGITPRELRPAEYETLLDYGIGLTDLVKHKAGMDRVLGDSDLAAGRERLRRQMLEYRPAYLCFNGKRAARAFLDRRRVPFGLLAQRVEDTSIFAAPSTSAVAARWWDIEAWQSLAGRIARAD